MLFIMRKTNVDLNLSARNGSKPAPTESPKNYLNPLTLETLAYRKIQPSPDLFFTFYRSLLSLIKNPFIYIFLPPEWKFIISLAERLSRV